MLEKLLRIIAAKGTECSAELARQLGVTPALMENMLNELTRQGYLKIVASGCAVSCERCPLRAACLYRRQPRIWALSPKGEEFLTGLN